MPTARITLIFIDTCLLLFCIVNITFVFFKLQVLLEMCTTSFIIYAFVCHSGNISCQSGIIVSLTVSLYIIRLCGYLYILLWPQLNCCLSRCDFIHTIRATSRAHFFVSIQIDSRKQGWLISVISHHDVLNTYLFVYSRLCVSVCVHSIEPPLNSLSLLCLNIYPLFPPAFFTTSQLGALSVRNL